MVLACHGRLQAAKLLGMTEVPTLLASGLTQAQKRAYVLADNKLTEKAGWGQEMLALGLVVVSGNLGEFRRVNDLRSEDWMGERQQAQLPAKQSCQSRRIDRPQGRCRALCNWQHIKPLIDNQNLIVLVIGKPNSQIVYVRVGRAASDRFIIGSDSSFLFTNIKKRILQSVARPSSRAKNQAMHFTL